MAAPKAVAHHVDNDNNDTQHGGLNFVRFQWLWQMLRATSPGLGLFGESYILFSIGTLEPLWQILFDNNDNDDTTTKSTSGVRSHLALTAVLGVMVGMVCFGVLANTLGRRRGSIGTAALMSWASVGLVVVVVVTCHNDYNQTQNNVNTRFRILAGILFVFGIGVGGEYPLSASSASERTSDGSNHSNDNNNHNSNDIDVYKIMTTMDNNNNNEHHATPQPPLLQQDSTNNNDSQSSSSLLSLSRAQRVQMVFSMQGAGILANSMVVTLLLLLFGVGNVRLPNNNNDNNNNIDYNDQNHKLLQIWQWTYVIGALVLVYVFLHRLRHLPESSVWQEDQFKSQLAHAELMELRQSQQQQQHYHTAPSPPIAHTCSSISSMSSPSVVMPSTPDSGSAKNGTMMMMIPPNEDDDYHHHHKHYSPKLLFLRHYGMRLFGCSLSWLLWDIAFYGNKLFQAQFLMAVFPSANNNNNNNDNNNSGSSSMTLWQMSLASTLNAAVALLGYYGAACLLDRVGRRNLQMYGLLVTGILLVTCGLCYNSLTNHDDDNHHHHAWIIAFLYIASSFLGQIGPNATTFLLPAEVLPTSVRTGCHGIAAACGKLGALLAAIFFPKMLQLDSNNNVDDPNAGTVDLLVLTGYASLVSAAVTYWTIPEVGGLSLEETDACWHAILRGRPHGYRGPALQYEFLSPYERQHMTMVMTPAANTTTAGDINVDGHYTATDY